MLKYYDLWHLHSTLKIYILGITVFAATEKLQLKIEGGGGQRTYF